MRRRFPWSLLLGMGLGLLLLRNARRRRARRGRARLPREPEVVRRAGLTPVEAGLERPVASGSPEPIPERTFRRTRARDAVARGEGFEPVVPDAPEERDPADEPAPVDPDVAPGTPVTPVVRRHRH